MKPGFIIYWDIYPAIQELPLEEKGKLFDAIFIYSIKGETLELSGMTKMAFNFIKQALDRDTQRYEKIVKRNQLNGKKGGRPRNPENPVGYLGTQKTQMNPKKPTTTTTTTSTTNKKRNIKEKVFVIDLDKEKAKEELVELITWFNEKQNAAFKTEGNPLLRLIPNFNYWREGYSLEEMKKAVENISKHPFWSGQVVDMTWLLSVKTSKEGAVDRFAMLLNVDGKATAPSKMPRNSVDDFINSQFKKQ